MKTFLAILTLLVGLSFTGTASADTYHRLDTPSTQPHHHHHKHHCKHHHHKKPTTGS